MTWLVSAILAALVFIIPFVLITFGRKLLQNPHWLGGPSNPMRITLPRPGRNRWGYEAVPAGVSARDAREQLWVIDGQLAFVRAEPGRSVSVDGWGGSIGTRDVKGNPYLSTLPCRSLKPTQLRELIDSGELLICPQRFAVELTIEYEMGGRVEVREKSSEECYLGALLEALGERELRSLCGDQGLSDALAQLDRMGRERRRTRIVGSLMIGLVVVAVVVALPALTWAIEFWMRL